MPGQGFFINFGKDIAEIGAEYALNCTATPETCEFKDMSAVVSAEAPEDIYISPVGCCGIIRRKQERNLKINSRLEEVLLSISSQMSAEEIEKRSRIQRRGRFSDLPMSPVSGAKDASYYEESEAEVSEDNVAQAVAFAHPATGIKPKKQPILPSKEEPVQLTLFDFLS